MQRIEDKRECDGARKDDVTERMARKGTALANSNWLYGAETFSHFTYCVRALHRHADNFKSARLQAQVPILLFFSALSSPPFSSSTSSLVPWLQVVGGTQLPEIVQVGALVRLMASSYTGCTELQRGGGEENTRVLFFAIRQHRNAHILCFFLSHLLFFFLLLAFCVIIFIIIITTHNIY